MKSRIYTVEAVVLKRKVSGEADRILTVFSKQFGKIRVLAKGIRKIRSRRAGHLEVFSRVVLTLHSHGSMDIVSEAQIVDGGSFVSRDPGKVAYAYCICELVDQLLADHQEHSDIYEDLTLSLETLMQKNTSQEWQEIMSEFVHKMLWNLGFLPNARHIAADLLRPYIENITERKLKTWPLLTVLGESRRLNEDVH